MKNQKKFDFVAIGDVTTDAFIRIKEANISCDVNREKCMICMRFADKIPYDFVKIVPAVGNSANAAVSAARLGLSSGLVSDVGDDYQGAECIEMLKKNGVVTDFIRTHSGKKTNYHFVLWFEDERTILIKHEDFNYDGVPETIDEPKWLYLSSLGEQSTLFHSQIAKFLDNHREVNLAFQPGTFQMHLGKEKLADIYQHTKVFICNVAEAQKVLMTQENDVKKLMKSLSELGPKIVLVTDGPKGAYAYDRTEYWFMPPYPDPKPPYERTGAGDAFSSTFVSALAFGKSLPDALMWAPINSMSVVQYIGAQEGLLTREKLEEYLAKAPTDYKPRKI
ncbi:MAG: carbohydrate kinase family protein [Patescibacteria group bacterium]